MRLEKKFDENGVITPNYAAIIKQLCKENDRKFFEDKLVEIDNYFKERGKYGYPKIKTGGDLYVECQLGPLVRRCLSYLDSGGVG